MDAVLALSGRAQETRLTIFRRLVQTGPEGEAAGRLAERFVLPAATLSLHLSRLCQCGLLRARREGRRIVYSADYEGMDRLMTFLTEKCCGGREDICAPGVAREEGPARQRVGMESTG